MIAGTYLNEDACLILYYDSQLKYALFHRWTNQEYYSELKEDLENLQRLGISLASVTCDGKKAIINAVKKVYTTSYYSALYRPHSAFSKDLAYKETQNNGSKRSAIFNRIIASYYQCNRAKNVDDCF